MRANCRNCKYFIPVSKMSNDLKEECLIWIAKHRPSEELLGYCSKFKRPVTYFEGICSGYKPKRKSEGCIELIKFLTGVKNEKK